MEIVTVYIQNDSKTIRIQVTNVTQFKKLKLKEVIYCIKRAKNLHDIDEDTGCCLGKYNLT